MYFSYDPDDGFELHETEEKAKARAEESLQYHRDEAGGDGWPEGTSQICWGKVSAKVDCVKETQRPPASELDEDGYDQEGVYWGDFDVMQDFALLPVDNAEAEQQQNKL